MIVTEIYAVCDGCGFRVPGDEYPEDWPSIVQNDRRATYCSRECLRDAIAGTRPLAPRNHLGLTDRDVAIIEMAAQGLRNKQIGQRLERSEPTIKGRMSELLHQLGAVDRTQLVVVAHARGLIDCAQLAAESDQSATS